MYAAFDKNTQKITLSFPVVTSGIASFQGQSNDTASTPSYTWLNDSNTGLYHPQNDTIGVVTNGVERMRVVPNGNIGIGTTQPLGKLHVQGTTTALSVSNGGNVGIGTFNPVEGFSMQVAGYSLLPLPMAIMEERYNAATIAYVNGTALNISSPAPTATTNINTWRERRLNTFTYPTDTSDFVRTSLVTLDIVNYLFTLAVGTYHIYAEGTGISVGRHRIALTSDTGTINKSTPSIVVAGTSEITYPVAATEINNYLNNATNSIISIDSSKSTISGFFTVTDPNLKYRIQHFTDQQDAIGAFGVPASSGTADVYLRVILTRYR